jgi:hypothetical protein
MVRGANFGGKEFPGNWRKEAQHKTQNEPVARAVVAVWSSVIHWQAAAANSVGAGRLEVGSPNEKKYKIKCWMRFAGCDFHLSTVPEPYKRPPTSASTCDGIKRSYCGGRLGKDLEDRFDEH